MYFALRFINQECFNITPLATKSIDDPRPQPILPYIYFPEVGTNAYPNLTAVIYNTTTYMQNGDDDVDSAGNIGSVIPVPAEEQPKMLLFLNGSRGLNVCYFNTSASQDAQVEARTQAFQFSLESTFFERTNNYFNNILATRIPTLTASFTHDVYQTYLSLFAESNYLNLTGDRDRQLLQGTNVGWVDRLFVPNLPTNFISATSYPSHVCLALLPLCIIARIPKSLYASTEALSRVSPLCW
ncbi:hypothetical protein M422DRAFT_242555 [Sphaerobolus stellatus SS14]|nr:hypothetical protein M422DRAFT_242555 [Sphaerobolus stellatus SS14]